MQPLDGCMGSCDHGVQPLPGYLEVYTRTARWLYLLLHHLLYHGVTWFSLASCAGPQLNMAYLASCAVLRLNMAHPCIVQ